MTYNLPQWSTALDLDFTTLPALSIATDGTYTIGTNPYTGAGLVWNKINSASDQSAMVITNSTGLVITPNSASNISGSTFTAPALRIPINSIIPDWTVFMPFRIWVWESASNEAANFDQMFYGTFIAGSGVANQLTYGHFRGFEGATNGWGAQLTVLNTNVVQTTTSINVPASPNNRVGLMTYPNGILGGTCPLLVGNTVTTVNTTIAAASGGLSLPQTTINVASTAGFTAPGFVNITTNAGSQTVYYTGIAGNSFTGCQGGTGTMTTGQYVSFGTWPTLNNLNYCTSAGITASSSAAIASSSSGALTTPSVNFFLSALRAGSGTAFAATIARFRVDYIPINN